MHIAVSSHALQKNSFSNKPSDGSSHHSQQIARFKNSKVGSGFFGLPDFSLNSSVTTKSISGFYKSCVSSKINKWRHKKLQL